MKIYKTSESNSVAYRICVMRVNNGVMEVKSLYNGTPGQPRIWTPIQVGQPLRGTVYVGTKAKFCLSYYRGLVDLEEGEREILLTLEVPKGSVPTEEEDLYMGGEAVVTNPIIRKIQFVDEIQHMSSRSTRIYKIAKGFRRSLNASQMVDFILNNNLRDWNGKLEYQDAKDIAYWSNNWVLTTIPLDSFGWTADPKQRNPSEGIPPIVLNDGGYEVLDGKHRIGMAKAKGINSMEVYLGSPETDEEIDSRLKTAKRRTTSYSVTKEELSDRTRYYLAEPNGNTLNQEGEPIGRLVVQSNMDDKFYILTGFKIDDPDQRGQGLGSLLMREFLVDPKWMDKPILVEPLSYGDWEDTKYNNFLTSMYQHFGFEPYQGNWMILNKRK